MDLDIGSHIQYWTNIKWYHLWGGWLYFGTDIVMVKDKRDKW